LKNNSFTSFTANSISDVKFANLRELDLENAFESNSPEDLILQSFAGLGEIRTINVSGNNFIGVDTNIFTGCTLLTSFDMDTSDKALFVNVLSSIEDLTGATTFTNRKSFGFQTDVNSNDKVDIKIPNFAGKRTYTTDEVNNFDLSERVYALEDKNVNIDRIEIDPRYADVPPQPTNLDAVISSNGVTVSFDEISNADRVIVRITSSDSPNVEEVVLAADATSFEHTGYVSGTTLFYEIFGENTRSIIKNRFSSFSINAPVEEASP